MLSQLTRINLDPYALTSVLSAFISMLFLAGLLLSMRGQMKQLIKTVQMSRRLPRVRGLAKQIDPGGAMKSIANLLEASVKRSISPTAFLCMEIALFFIVFTASATNLSIPLSALLGLSFSAIPWLFLRLKLERIRRRGSYEGETLISSLLTQYWVSGGNIFDTIEKVIANPKGIRVSAGMLSSLLITMRSTGNRHRIREAADSFAYGIGTNWGRMLAWNIRNAALSGCDIGLALEDILIQLREARALHEERKRINNESARLSFFLVPVIYIGTVVVSIGMLGLSPGRFFRNQFMTPEGFALISFTIFLFLLNIVLVEVVTNRKLDF